MFNKKLKQQIISLQAKSCELATKNRKLEEQIMLLEWKVNNPPKHKVGDKIKNHIITSRQFHKQQICNLQFVNMFQPRTIEFKPNHYSYTLTNNKTGEILELTELDLINHAAKFK